MTVLDPNLCYDECDKKGLTALWYCCLEVVSTLSKISLFYLVSDVEQADSYFHGWNLLR